IITIEPRKAIWLATVLENRERFNPKHHYNPHLRGAALAAQVDFDKDIAWNMAYRASHEEADHWRSAIRAEYDGLDTFPERFAYFTNHEADGLGAIVLVGMFAGLRFGEAAALRESSLTLDQKPRLTVLEAATEVRGVVAIGPPKT